MCFASPKNVIQYSITKLNTRRVLCPLGITDAVSWVLLHCDTLAMSLHCFGNLTGNNTFEKKRQNSDLGPFDNHFAQK